MAESFQPTMQMMRATVLCQVIFFSVQLESSITDSIANATNDAAHVSLIFKIT